MAGGIGIFSEIHLGDVPSTNGIIRIPNNYMFTARNAADTGNVEVFKVNVNDRLELICDVEGIDVAGQTNTSGLTVSGATSLQDVQALSIKFGSQAAQSGRVRLPNNDGVAARNAAGTSDVELLKLNASDRAVIRQLESLDVNGQAHAGSLDITNGSSLGDVEVRGHVRFGSFPAQTGFIRLSNNEAIFTRNAANSADVALIKLNANNRAELPQLESLSVAGAVAYGSVSSTGAMTAGTLDVAGEAKVGRFEARDVAKLLDTEALSLKLGTHPAQVGLLRLPNNEAMFSRNAANTADVAVVKLNATNEVEFGATIKEVDVHGPVYGWSENIRDTASVGSLVVRGAASLQNTDALSVRVGVGLAKPVAQTGLIRMPNDEFIFARNPEDSGDIGIAKIDQNGRILFGTDVDNIDVEGAAIVGSLVVDGAAEISGLSVTGDTALSGLSVSGSAAFSSITCSGLVESSGLTVTGDTSLGALTTSDTATVAALTVPGLTNLGNTTIVGGLGLDNATASGRVTSANLTIGDTATIQNAQFNNDVNGPTANVGLFGIAANTPNTGNRTIRMGNAVAAPGHAFLSGGVLYVQEGALWFRGGNGTPSMVACA